MRVDARHVQAGHVCSKRALRRFFSVPLLWPLGEVFGYSIPHRARLKPSLHWSNSAVATCAAFLVHFSSHIDSKPKGEVKERTGQETAPRLVCAPSSTLNFLPTCLLQRSITASIRVSSLLSALHYTSPYSAAADHFRLHQQH